MQELDRRPMGDCVCHAVAIATGISYSKIFALLARAGCGDPTHGIDTRHRRFRRLMNRLGFRLVRSRHGRRVVRFNASEIPSSGRLVLLLHRHAVAVVDGTLWDGIDTSLQGRAIVHGIYRLYRPQPNLPEAHRNLADALAAIVEDVAGELRYRAQRHGSDAWSQLKAIEVAAERWPYVSRARWDFAVRRALAQVERIRDAA